MSALHIHEIYRAKPDDDEALVMDASMCIERLKGRNLRHYLGSLEDMRDTLDNLIRKAR